MNRIYVSTLLGTLMVCLGLQTLQAQDKIVNIRIVSESDGYKKTIDTTFTLSDVADIDEVVEMLIDEDQDVDESVETMIIIRDSDKNERHEQHVVTQNKDKDHSHNSANSRAMMGVYLDTDGRRNGVRITTVIDGGSAQAAGMLRGDVITEIDGERIETYNDLVEKKREYGVGDAMNVIFMREDEEYEATMVLRSKAEQDEMGTIMRWEREGTPRAFMGVYTDEVTAERARAQGMDNQQGVYIEGVVPGAGAEQAGLREGDILTEIDGQVIDASHEMTEALRDKAPGDQIRITYMRDGKACTVNTTLGRRERVVKEKEKIEVKKPFLGIYPTGHDNNGIYVNGVVENSSAEDAGLEQGDIIVGMNDMRIRNSHDLSEALEEIGPGNNVTIFFLRDGERMKEKVSLGYKTSTKWKTVERYREDDGEQMNIEVEEEVAVDPFATVEDQAQRAQLRSFMENPTLEMDLFEFFPNPNDGQFTLRFQPAQAGDLQIRIYTPSGQEIYQEQIADFSGTYDKAIDISRNVSRGVYFLQVTQGQRGMVERIIIK